MTVVVDASVALDWCLESERSAYAADVLEHVSREGAVVPSIWPAEVANGLLSARKRGRITLAETANAIAMLHALKIDLERDPRIPLSDLVEVGDRFGLTAYDAAYLRLSMQLGIPMATNDEALRKAARKSGVSLFGRT